MNNAHKIEFLGYQNASNFINITKINLELLGENPNNILVSKHSHYSH